MKRESFAISFYKHLLYIAVVFLVVLLITFLIISLLLELTKEEFLHPNAFKISGKIFHNESVEKEYIINVEVEGTFPFECESGECGISIPKKDLTTECHIVEIVRVE